MLLQISHSGAALGWFFSFVAGCPLRSGTAGARLLLGCHQTAAPSLALPTAPQVRPDTAPPPGRRRGRGRGGGGELGEVCRRGCLPYLDEAPAVQGGVHAARHLPSQHHRAVPVAQPPAPPQAVHLRAARTRGASPARRRHQQQQQQQQQGGCSAHGGARLPHRRPAWPPAGASGRPGGPPPRPRHRHGPQSHYCGTTDRQTRGGEEPLPAAPAARPRLRRVGAALRAVSGRWGWGRGGRAPPPVGG